MGTYSNVIRTIVAATAGLGLTSCAASTFLKVQPAQANGPWVNGNPTTVFSHPDSVYVRTGFIRAEDRELVFEVAYLNYSDKPVVIAPANFYCLAVPDTLADSVAVPAQYFEARQVAANPTLRLAQLKARLQEEDRKANNVSWFEILTSAVNIAEDISSIKKKETDQQIAERDARHQDDQAYFDNQRLHHAAQADELDAQTTALEHVILQPDTLAPGQGVKGQVFFPRQDRARKLRLVVFFDERPVQFVFRQALMGSPTYQPLPPLDQPTQP